MYEREGKYSLDEPLYQRALAMCENQLGPEHHYTATIRENYHVLVSNIKRQGKA